MFPNVGSLLTLFPPPFSVLYTRNQCFGKRRDFLRFPCLPAKRGDSRSPGYPDPAPSAWPRIPPPPTPGPPIIPIPSSLVFSVRIVDACAPGVGGRECSRGRLLIRQVQPPVINDDAQYRRPFSGQAPHRHIENLRQFPRRQLRQDELAELAWSRFIQIFPDGGGFLI